MGRLGLYPLARRCSEMVERSEVTNIRVDALILSKVDIFAMGSSPETISLNL